MSSSGPIGCSATADVIIRPDRMFSNSRCHHPARSDDPATASIVLWIAPSSRAMTVEETPTIVVSSSGPIGCSATADVIIRLDRMIQQQPVSSFGLPHQVGQ
jgi:hypothetical protein